MPSSSISSIAKEALIEAQEGNANIEMQRQSLLKQQQDLQAVTEQLKQLLLESNDPALVAIVNQKPFSKETHIVNTTPKGFFPLIGSIYEIVEGIEVKPFTPAKPSSVLVEIKQREKQTQDSIPTNILEHVILGPIITILRAYQSLRWEEISEKLPKKVKEKLNPGDRCVYNYLMRYSTEYTYEPSIVLFERDPSTKTWSISKNINSSAGSFKTRPHLKNLDRIKHGGKTFGGNIMDILQAYPKGLHVKEISRILTETEYKDREFSSILNQVRGILYYSTDVTKVAPATYKIK